MKDSQKEALRLVIRELLAQELAALRKEQVKSQESSKIKEESVKVESTEELTAFARRICALAQDKQAREDIESGRWVFHLCNADKMEESRYVRFEKGVVGEKQVASLTEDSCIWAGKRVCFTPLALDEIRRRRIRIEKEN